MARAATRKPEPAPDDLDAIQVAALKVWNEQGDVLMSDKVGRLWLLRADRSPSPGLYILVQRVDHEGESLSSSSLVPQHLLGADELRDGAVRAQLDALAAEVGQ